MKWLHDRLIAWCLTFFDVDMLIKVNFHWHSRKHNIWTKGLTVWWSDSDTMMHLVNLVTLWWYYANHKTSRTFDCRFWQFYLNENLKTTWDLERDFQGASFEPNRIFLALFVWEILKDKVKNCKFGFRSKIHFHLFSLLILKKTFVFVHE